MITYQRPNRLLSIGLILLILSKLPTHLQHPVGIAASLVLGAWAIDEIRHGVNLFRRVLGSVVLIVIFMNLVAK